MLDVVKLYRGLMASSKNGLDGNLVPQGLVYHVTCGAWILSTAKGKGS